MRVRALSSTGDKTFGHSEANFLIKTPQAVAQVVMTRLKLWQGEWFLDVTEGTPYSTQILGTGTNATYDAAIQLIILQTIGVVSIKNYSSNLSNRALSVSADIVTVYDAPGQASQRVSI